MGEGGTEDLLGKVGDSGAVVVGEGGKVSILGLSDGLLREAEPRPKAFDELA